MKLQQRDRFATDSETAPRRRVEHRHAQEARPEPTAVPRIAVRTRYIDHPAKSRFDGVAAIAQAGLFLAVSGITYLFGGLYGGMLVEQARSDVSEAKSRAVEARKAEVAIRQRVTLLTRADKIEEWGLAHGMVAPDGLGETASVAGNDTNAQ